MQTRLANVNSVHMSGGTQKPQPIERLDEKTAWLGCVLRNLDQSAVSFLTRDLTEKFQMTPNSSF